jgi:putative membrane protein
LPRRIARRVFASVAEVLPMAGLSALAGWLACSDCGGVTADGLEANAMMYGYGAGWWMLLMPLLWIALIGVIVWAAVRVAQPAGTRRTEPYRETPQEILDRRYARGEIDDDTYVRARARLSGQEPSSS